MGTKQVDAESVEEETADRGRVPKESLFLAKVEVCHRSEGTCRIVGYPDAETVSEDGVAFKRFFAQHLTDKVD